jgi:GNAT superfamily N-acetyltransferase
VGTIDGVTIGYGIVRVEHLRDGGRLGVIDDLFVLPGARAIGVGEAMMDELLAFCEDRGCLGIDSIALPGNRHTKNFFETFGLVARAILVHRPLPRPDRSGGLGPAAAPDGRDRGGVPDRPDPDDDR